MLVNSLRRKRTKILLKIFDTTEVKENQWAPLNLFASTVRRGGRFIREAYHELYFNQYISQYINQYINQKTEKIKLF